ncbi:hypothetical protein PVAP13_6NG201500 [Panicum virgatum]|uniref:peptidylprolyl isomerase n=1 Tax=Panicum virgatum TaxID=38727 RepID=A0A8T0QXP0_PANVG|nr:hypothetical protein PVAP13_6NG201500 [Panicum virgatum]
MGAPSPDVGALAPSPPQPPPTPGTHCPPGSCAPHAFPGRASDGMITIEKRAVRLIGRLQDGTVFVNKGHNGTKTYEIKTSQDQVVDGLDEAITHMTEGTVYLVTVPPDHAFGSEGSQQQLAFVPANATVTFEVELVSIISKRKHFGNMETKECINTAWKKKEEGDELVRFKQYKQASKRYDKVNHRVNSSCYAYLSNHHNVYPI